MKLSDIIQIEACRSMFGKLTGGFVASAFGLAEKGKTKDDAVELLVARINSEIRNRYRRIYEFAADGTVFVMYYNDGWCYDIMSPDRKAPCTTHGDDDFDYCLDRMRNHARTFV